MFIRDVVTLTTKVNKIDQNDDQYIVSLQDTCFYPTGGGQLHDIGYINDAKILDVYKQGDEILHVVDRAISGEVNCVLDVVRRYEHSLLHSAQHLFSYVVEKAGYDTTSFNMKAKMFTMDIVGVVNREQLDEFEKAINALIMNGNAVITRKYVSGDCVDISNYGIDLNKLYVVEMAGLVTDVCGGTHINNLSELKYLKIVSYKVSNGKTKVTIYIGEDAINYVNKYFNNFYDLVKLVNQDEDHVLSYVGEKLRTVKKLQKELKKLQ